MGILRAVKPKEDAPMPDQLLKRHDVEKLCKISRSAIYRLMRAKQFPEPIRIGPRAVRWPASEIEAWLASRPRATGERPGAA